MKKFFSIFVLLFLVLISVKAQVDFVVALPRIDLDPATFSFSATQGGSNPPPQTLKITNGGASGSTLNWTAQSSVAWLSVTQETGSTSAGSTSSVTLSVNISGLPVGEYSGSVTVSDPNASNTPQLVSVTLEVTPSAPPPLPPPVVPGNVITGWAWIGADCTDPSGATCGATTNPIGWVSFNYRNTITACDYTGVKYEVKVDYDTGELSGQAWIDGLGWLDFDYGDAGHPQAKIVSPAGRYQIQDWSPIVAGDPAAVGNIINWVRFNGSNYGVLIDSATGTASTNANERYAWASGFDEATLADDIGWIDFKQIKFPPPANSPPSTPVQLNATPVAGLSLTDPNADAICTDMIKPIFSWKYSDPNGDPESAYQIQIKIGSNDFLTIPPDIDTGKTSFAHDNNTICPITRFTLEYGTHYYWKVKVWDDKGLESDWSVPQDFYTPFHVTDFSWAPSNPVLGQTISFSDDGTLFYEGATSITARKWTFPSVFTLDLGSTDISSKPQGKFAENTQPGIYTFKLKSTDNGMPNTTCSARKSMPISLPLPEYKEIIPR